MNANLGCEGHVIPGWKNLDPRWKMFPGSEPWQWNESLPLPDGESDLVLVQHSLEHCSPDDYAWNFREILRVLRPGGRLLLKECDNRRYVWRKPGQKPVTGLIRSSTNLPEAEAALLAAGFEIETDDPQEIISRHGDVVNRQGKLQRGLVFAVLARKPMSPL